MQQGYVLYEHRQDESILIVARPSKPPENSYECRRWGESETFRLPEAAFLSIYRRRRSDRV